MTIAEYIVFVIAGIYSLTIFLLSMGWYRLKPARTKEHFEHIPVSIIIACRNEEQNIESLLQSLLTQNYPKELTEIIMLDDHSVDHTYEIISEFVQKYSNIKLFKLPDNEFGKKSAIALGVENATSEVIVTTDADCTMNANWLRSMVSFYQQNDAELISGPVTFHKSQNVFQQFQTLEFLSLIGAGAGAIGMHRPIMCNGANLLFKKDLYKEHHMQKNYVSGDDIFLMLHAKKKKRKDIRFNQSKYAIVYTNPNKNIRDFFNQRIRWTSKSRAYRDFDVIAVALIIAMLNFSFIASLIYGLFNIQYLYIPAIILLTKSFFDLLLLVPVTRFFKQQKLLCIFLPLQIIYPFYIIWTVIKGLIGKFVWKSRKSG